MFLFLMNHHQDRESIISSDVRSLMYLKKQFLNPMGLWVCYLVEDRIVRFSSSVKNWSKLLKLTLIWMVLHFCMFKAKLTHIFIVKLLYTCIALVSFCGNVKQIFKSSKFMIPIFSGMHSTCFNFLLDDLLSSFFLFITFSTPSLLAKENPRMLSSIIQI